MLDQSTEDWDTMFNTNVKAVWMLARLVGKKMAADGKGGSIINISSALGNPGGVVPGVASYSVTKAAVQQLTRK